jgi:hypothetical protein
VVLAAALGVVPFSIMRIVKGRSIFEVDVG